LILCLNCSNKAFTMAAAQPAPWTMRWLLWAIVKWALGRSTGFSEISGAHLGALMVTFTFPSAWMMTPQGVHVVSWGSTMASPLCTPPCPILPVVPCGHSWPACCWLFCSLLLCFCFLEWFCLCTLAVVLLPSCRETGTLWCHLVLHKRCWMGVWPPCASSSSISYALAQASSRKYSQQHYTSRCRMFHPTPLSACACLVVSLLLIGRIVSGVCYANKHDPLAPQVYVMAVASAMHIIQGPHMHMKRQSNHHNRVLPAFDSRVRKY